jgi:hypothetical protein
MPKKCKTRAERADDFDVERYIKTTLHPATRSETWRALALGWDKWLHYSQSRLAKARVLQAERLLRNTWADFAMTCDD